MMERGYRKISENQIFSNIEEMKNLKNREYEKKIEISQVFLHKMYILLEKSDDIGLDENPLQFFRSEPFVSHKSLSSTWSRI